MLEIFLNMAFIIHHNYFEISSVLCVSIVHFLLLSSIAM